MSRRSLCCCLRLAVLVIAVVTLSGQRAFSQRTFVPPPRETTGTRSTHRLTLLFLANRAGVHRELALNPEVIEKIGRLVMEFSQEGMDMARAEGERMGKAFGEVYARKDLSPEERDAKIRELSRDQAKRIRKRSDEYAKRLQPILSDDRFRRLQEIYRQTAGGAALQDDDVAEALELSNEQRLKIATILDDFDDLDAKLRRESRGREDAEEVDLEDRKREQGLRERDDKALEVLTKPQKETLTELKGKPFDQNRLQPRRINAGDANTPSKS